MSDERFSVPAPSLGWHLGVELHGGRVVRASFLRAAWPDAPRSEAACDAAALLARHFERGDAELAQIPVDLSSESEFHARVLAALHATHPGETLTYGELAARAGVPGTAQAVGTAMARNPIPVIVPCHRVLPSTREIGEYSGLGGPATKAALLRLESRQPTLDAFGR